jgi:hypothetical protein
MIKGIILFLNYNSWTRQELKSLISHYYFSSSLLIRDTYLKLFQKHSNLGFILLNLNRGYARIFRESNVERTMTRRSEYCL